MKPSDFQVGQKVFFVGNRNTGGDGTPRERAITKVGRKWVEFKGSWETARFDPETMEVDGGQYASTGMVWLSEEAFETHKAAATAWDALARRVSPHCAPEGMTLAKVREIAALCGIDLDAAMKQDAR